MIYSTHCPPHDLQPLRLPVFGKVGIDKSDKFKSSEKLALKTNSGEKSAKLALTNPTNSTLSTCILLLHKMREDAVKAVTFVTRPNVSHIHSYLVPFYMFKQLDSSFKI